MATTIPFNKSYSNPHDIVSLLQSRGLHISDTNKAEHYIERIGYYRLSAYMHPFLCAPKELNRYKRNASFDKVMMLYRFDKKRVSQAFGLQIELVSGINKTRSVQLYPIA